MTTQQRWDNAIKRAMELDGESNARYVGNGRFLIVSANDPDAGAYRVDLGVIDGKPVVDCTCRASEFGQPCWHRATALLVGGYVDAPALT